MGDYSDPTSVQYAWAVMDWGKNEIDGPFKRFLGVGYINRLSLDQDLPEPVEGQRTMLFKTRRQCKAFIKEHFQSHKRRDLRAEPHGWRMPKAVRVKVTIEPLEEAKSDTE